MEEERRICSENEHNLQGIWFAAGVAVMIACLERAVVFSIFKQWRVWVFLTLNLLLLAILFTSSSPPSSQRSKTPPRKHKSDANHRDAQQQQQQQQTQREITSEYSDEDHGDGGGRSELLKLGGGGENGGELSVDREDGDSGDLESTATMPALSNEELNERVEAFIATFRQQYLVDSTDVKMIGGASSSSRRNSFHSPAAKGGSSARILAKTVSV